MKKLLITKAIVLICLLFAIALFNSCATPCKCWKNKSYIVAPTQKVDSVQFVIANNQIVMLR